jgi:hypothetical protein
MTQSPFIYDTRFYIPARRLLLSVDQNLVWVVRASYSNSKAGPSTSTFRGCNTSWFGSHNCHYNGSAEMLKVCGFHGCFSWLESIRGN